MSDEQNTPETPAESEYNLEAGPLKTSVEALMERLGLNKPTTEEAVESGTPSDGTAETAAQDAAGAAAAEEAFDPAKEDWTKYDLDPNIAHYYPKSQLVETGEGMVLVAPQVIFHTESLSTKAAGGYITQKVNGPEQWQLSALLPNGSGLMVVVLMRQVRVKLPQPILLETETKVDAPVDEELNQVEGDALAWAGAVSPEKQAVLDKIAAEAELQAAGREDFGSVEGADVQADA
jgi:hypothetical protein